MINVTKNGETKIYKAVQELKNFGNTIDGNQRNGDQPKISEQPKFVNRDQEQEQKMEEDLDFFINNNASQSKKKESTRRKKTNKP